MNFKKIINPALLCLTMIVGLGCVSLGQQLNYNQVASIQRNVTTEAQIRAMFGEPVTSELNMKRGVKILTYGYKNDDSIKKGAAATAGAVAGGALGRQVGGGSGRAVAGTVGALAGGILVGNAVTARREEQYLEVVIGLHSHRVVDYNYVESKGRTQRLGINSGVAPL